MKAALIPPIPNLDPFGRGDLHLLLAHLFKNKEYLHHYMQQRLGGAYLILDNSAHEFKTGVGAVELLNAALSVSAQEIVVPDVLDQGPETVERAVEALETWYENEEDTRIYNLNPVLMYVPQGRDVEEYYQCMEELVQLHEYMAKRKDTRRDFVLGISKDYDEWPCTLMEILETVEGVKDSLWEDKEIRMNVHLLGWSRNLWNLNTYARRFPWIRSTDSCRPFNYALNNIQLDPHSDPPPYPKRHRTHFYKQRLSAFQVDYAVHNVEVFKAAAEGRL